MDQRGRHFAGGLKKVWADQLGAALRNVRVGGIDFEWVASESWAQEIAQLTRGDWNAEASDGYDAGAAKVGGTKPAAWVSNPRATAWVDSNVFRFAKRVNDTTHDDLKRALADALSRGEGPDKFKAAVADVFRGYVQEQRAEMIARTELSRALNGGTAMAWKESGTVAAKEWDAAGDACPFCLSMDGRVMELDAAWFDEGDTFTVGWNGKPRTMSMRYGSVQFPPLHPNCRCTMLPVLHGTPKAEAMANNKPTKPTAPAKPPAPPPAARVFVRQSTIADLEAWAVANVRGMKACNLSGLSVDHANDVVRAAFEMGERYRFPVPRIGRESEFPGAHTLRGNHLMSANQDGIRVRPNHFTANAVNYLATSPHKAKASKDIHGYTLHELGHVAQYQPREADGTAIPFHLAEQVLKPIVTRYRRQRGAASTIVELGRYAWQGRNNGRQWMETWAEAFSAYHADPASVSDETRVMVERGLRALFPDLYLPPTKGARP